MDNRGFDHTFDDFNDLIRGLRAAEDLGFAYELKKIVVTHYHGEPNTATTETAAYHLRLFPSYAVVVEESFDEVKE